jgi:glutamate-ammonia-ligase adenylyltransferase
MQALPHNPQFPGPADLAAAARLHEDFAALGPTQRRFAASSAGRAVLDCLGGNAPYLADMACRESGCLIRTLKSGPDAALAHALENLRALPLAATRRQLASQLREAKRQAALAIAIADIGGLWRLPKITAALSEFAEAACRAATRHLLLSLHEAGQIALPHPQDPERDSGFTMLALGKLGARELNYSSDIDLVLFFDPQSPVYDDNAQPLMARLARDFTSLLATRDADGYVFRVDLRLRPDPSATPPVVALPAALAYYESQGRTWERAAFSKARPIAGDIAMGEAFLAAIRPFIWRKNLDFAAISDIHDMKRQIDAGHNRPGLLGRDVKRGQGGIREIEFIVQTLSLVWGGQDKQLRILATLDALPALVKAGHLPAGVARTLAADYRQLRRVEHRLQMVADRQTHALPATEEALSAFITFLGEPDFRRDFPRLLARVHRHFLAFFDAGDDPEQNRIDPGAEGPPPPAFTARVHQLGFTGEQHIAERLRAWSSGQVPALRSERARELLETILPPLLAVLGEQPEPDKVFAHFDTLLSRQRAGVQLLSLFQRNPAVLRRMAAVLGAAPALAEHLAEDPHALEALLSPTARFAAPKPVLRHLLRDADDLEDAVALTRHFVRREEFHLSVATLEGRMDADESGRLRSNLAAAALGALLPRVLAQHQARYGKVPRGAFAVVAMGKAGSGEMLAGSDLDLMLIYDHAPMESAPTPYFVRLANALTTALTVRGPEGPLYHVDMRLRPSGNHGPVAVSLASFRRYQAADAWTWERLALTRARVLAATPGFAAKVTAEIITALSRPDSPEKIRADTLSMRERIAAELPPRGPFDIKTIPGGMLELNFIAAALQLIHGPQAPELFHPNTAAALRALALAGHLPPAHAQDLLAADHLWRSVQGINRITGLSDRAQSVPPALQIPLLRATRAPSWEALRETMAQAAQNVTNCFEIYINQGVST